MFDFVYEDAIIYSKRFREWVYLKKKFKLPSAPTILFCIVVFVAILTWLVPAGIYECSKLPNGNLEPIAGSYREIASNRQGLWDIFFAPIKGFSESIEIGIYLMIMNAFITLVMKTGAISAGISKLTKKLAGKEILLIPILMFLFSLCGTILGFWEETLGFYMLIVPVFIASGYDAIVGLLVVMWGAGIGLIGSTLNPFATGIASKIANIPIGEGIVFRIVIYVLLLVIGSLYVMNYAKKVKKDPSSSLVFDDKKRNEEHFLNNTKENEEITSTHKKVLVVFGAVFVILILSVLPWADTFGITFFDNLNNKVLSIPVIKDILGPIVAFGHWDVPHLCILFLVASILVGFIGKFSEEDFINTFFSGVSDVMSVVFVIAIANGVKIIMTDGNITATILHYGENALSKLSGSFFACASFLFYLPLSFFIPTSSGLATLSVPLLAPLANLANVKCDIVITAYQVANGIINLIAPTSAVLMGALTITKVPYSAYMKSILKFLIIIVCMILVMLYLVPIL